MNITHLCLNGPFTDEWNYQENLLTKYLKKIGNNVSVITSEWIWSDKGQLVVFQGKKDYINKDNVRVIRLKLQGKEIFSKKIKRYKGLYDAIAITEPDIIFMHGVQSVENSTVVNYIKKHDNVRLIADNHADFSNSATNWVSKNILHKILWRHCAKKLVPYASVFYGVLPSRVDFLIDVYKIPKEKVKLLVMGADDELVEKASDISVRTSIREKYGVLKDDFLIVNGGKIDQWKKQTLLLMDAVNELENEKIKLLVFGSVTPELKSDMGKRLSDRVKYIGWVRSEDTYGIFAAGDVACFPGRHSVFWEQAAGQGIPMICKYWEGTTHVDCGGNVLFLKEDSVNEIKRAIMTIQKSFSDYKTKALDCKDTFSYSDIARRSIAEQ